MKNNRKEVLLVGGSSSLGQELTNIYLKNNYNVSATYFSNKTKLDSRVNSIHLDLLSEQSIVNSVKFLKKNSNFDIVVFLPGIIFGKKLVEYSIEEIKSCMDINFINQAYFLGKIINFLSNKCCVFFISSISGEKGSYDPIYAASKGAQNSFVKSLALWLSPSIRVNAVAPSLIENSNMFFDMDYERRDFHKSSSPMKKLLTLAQLSKIVFDLSSDHWDHLNGQIISVNGGQFLKNDPNIFNT